MGFDAYGATRDAPDPVAHAINCMLDHIHLMDRRMQRMCESLRQLGTEVDVAKMPDLGPCEIVSTAEELHRLQPEETDDTGHLRST
jgi:serine O-acetyltransferase